MNNLGFGLIVAGGFLFGVGMAHIVPLASILATVDIVMIAVGILAFFAIGSKKKV